MARWMINCKEHSQLMSKSMDYPLSFWNRLSLKIHQWVCPPCNRLKEQFNTIRKACRMSAEESDKDLEPESNTENMPEDVHRRLKSAVKEHLQ